MKRIVRIAKRVGVIFLTLCLLVTSGCFSDFAASLKKSVMGKMTAKAHELGESENPPEGYTEYTLYNFVQLVENGNVTSTYGRMKTTPIYTEGSPAELYSQHGNTTYTLRDDEYYVHPYDAHGQVVFRAGKYYAYMKDVLDESTGGIDASKLELYDGYYTLSGGDVVQVMNKLGGTSWHKGVSEYAGIPQYYYVTGKVEYDEPTDLRTFHRDFKICLYDKDVYFGEYDLYNFLYLNRKYYRLQGPTKIISFDPEVAPKQDGTVIDESLYTIVGGEYDFSNLDIEIDGVIYEYRPTDYQPTETLYTPYYTVEMNNASDVTVSVANRVHISSTPEEGLEWFNNEAGWLNINDWNIDFNTTAYHRNYKNAKLHKPNVRIGRVVWEDSNGQTLHEQSVPYGATPVLPDDIVPTSEEDPGEGYVWEWTGWESGDEFYGLSDAFAVVNSANTVYVAKFEKKAVSLSVTKSASPASDVAVGDTIEYTVVVTNNGAAPISDISLTDSLVTLSGENAQSFDLAVGASKTITYSYTVVQADVDKGKIDNTAQATGKDSLDRNVTAAADVSVTAVEAAAAIQVTKTAEPVSDLNVGDSITFTVVVKNTGNVSVKNGTLTDDHADLSDKSFALAPGEEASFTYSYTVTQEDVNNGSITNTVKANAESVRGDDPEEAVGEATVTAEAADAKLKVTKSADKTADAAVGDTITFTVVVENIGNVSVNNGSLEDDLADLSGETFALAPGETAEFEYTYTVVQADVDAGEIVNVVKVNASAVRGDDPAEVSATVTVTAEEANAELSVTKTAEPTDNLKVGDTITYTVIVENSGNVSISGITLNDSLVSLSGEAAEAFSLDPGSTKTITYTYTVTQRDVNVGTIDNTATATGLDPKKQSVTASDEVSVATEKAAPELTVTKTAGPSADVKAGDEIAYTVVVTNSGNVTIGNITVEDTLETLSVEPFSLVPGASKTITYTHTVTQGDVDAGEVENTATATGEGPQKQSVTASAKATVTTASAEAKIAVIKTAEVKDGVMAGDVITYTITVKNTGNVTVTDGSVEDTLEDLSAKTFTLAPGEEVTFTYDYMVTEADVLAGKVENAVTVDAKAARGNDPETAEAAKTIVTGRNALVITSATTKWTYDGQLHKDDTYTVTYDGEELTADDATGKVFTLANGDVLTITSTAEGVKDYDVSYLGNNTFTYTITNEELYENIVANEGTLSIDKRTVTLSSESAEKTYDGTALIRPTVVVGGDGFAEGEVTDLKAEGSALNVSDGEVFNTITYTTTEKFNADNYVITKDEGVLRVWEREVTVTITGNSDSKPYNGELQSVSGYTTEISHPLYTEDDFEYYAVAEAGGVLVGEYPMVILAEQCLNNNGNFIVTFVVKNGKMTIEPNNSVVVKINGRDETVEYDGTLHTLDAYDIEISDPIYTEYDFEFSKNLAVSGKDAGSYAMTMKPEDFVNTNSNFGTVTFEVVNGTLTVEPKEVSIEWSEEREYPYDGKMHQPEATVSGLVDGDSCDVTVEGGQTEIGDDYIASAVALSNPNYKLPEKAEIPFEIYGCVVIFADDLGKELQVKTVPYGDIPSYDGDEPTKESNSAAYRYVFAGWNSEIVPVTERSTTYKARFTEVTNGYMVKWVDGKGNVLQSEVVLYGTKPEYTGKTPETFENNGFIYTFNGEWSPIVTLVVEDATYTAQYDEKPIKEYYLKSGDGSEYEKESGKLMRFVFSSNYDSETFRHFAKAFVDGQPIPENGYTATEGSLILDLKPEYLDQLSIGSHTVSVTFDDYETAVEAVFAVIEKKQQEPEPTPEVPSPTPEEPTPTPAEDPVIPAPQTGDTMNLYLVIGVIAAALVTILLIIFKRKRSEEE